MKPVDFLLLMAVCFVWGINLPWTRVIVADVPPIFTAGLRFAGIALCLIPFLRPVPKQLGQVFLIAMGIGALHFMLLFLGLAFAPASAVAIVGQIGLPIVTVLSIVFLGETVRWRRILGMVLAFVGVLVILWKPGAVSLQLGLLFVVGAAVTASVGSIIMKQIMPIPALNLQAWVGLFSFLPLLLASAIFETGQIEGLVAGGWLVWTGIGFSIFVVSIFGHSSYYQILKKYDVTLIAPMTLVVPVWAVLISVLFLGEPLGPQLLLGGLITLAGVALVASRENKSLPVEALTGSDKT